MQKISIYLFILTIFFILQACNNDNIIVQENKKFSNEEWNMDSIAHFEFRVTDTSSFYNLFIETQNTDDYPYSNIWFFSQLKTQNGSQISDSLEYTLCDKKGKWYGKNSKGVYKLWNLYKANVRFAAKGTYQLELQHGMRKIILPGIKSVSLIIQKNKH